MKIAGLATIPSRKEMLFKVVESLLPQVDQLHIYFDYDVESEVPDFHDPKIVYWVKRKGEELGDIGKYAPLIEGYPLPPDFYYLSCDDDIEYPPDYVMRMSAACAFFHRRALISLHGSTILNPPVESYYRNRLGIACLKYFPVYAHMQFPGTGVSCFHSSTFKLRRKDFSRKNMADIWVGMAAAEQDVPVIVAPHSGTWLQYLNPPLMDTIWGKEHRDDSVQTAIVNQFLLDSGLARCYSLGSDFPNAELVYYPGTFEGVGEANSWLPYTSLGKRRPPLPHPQS